MRQQAARRDLDPFLRLVLAEAGLRSGASLTKCGYGILDYLIDALTTLAAVQPLFWTLSTNTHWQEVEIVCGKDAWQNQRYRWK